MFWHCKLCDYIMTEGLKNKHLNSKFHNTLVNSNVMKYIIPNRNSSKIADRLKKNFFYSL